MLVNDHKRNKELSNFSKTNRFAKLLIMSIKKAVG